MTLARKSGATKRTSTRKQSRAPKLRQLTFERRGGKRRGAGRKPAGARPLVSHSARAPLAARFPVLVTTRIRAGLPSLRRPGALDVLTSAFVACASNADQHGLRLVHYSIQSNHLHWIVEARDAESLSRGMQGLLVRIARNLNRLWQRKGSIFADRYHAHILRTPREVRNALVYVLHNARKHGCNIVGVDPFSSGRAFDGWKTCAARVPDEHGSGRSPPVLAARTWLLTYGWRRHGLIDLAESPHAWA